MAKNISEIVQAQATADMAANGSLANPAPYRCKHGCERDEVMGLLEAALTRIDALEAALEPFAFFANAYDAQPTSSPDSLFTIHIGTPYEARVRLSDLRKARGILHGTEASNGEKA